MLPPTRPPRVPSHGYTMVELLIVLTIVGVLTATVGMLVIGTTETGGSAACEESRDAAASAVMNHYTMTGAYPGGFAEMLDSGALRFGPGVVIDRTSRWAESDDWRLLFRPGTPPTFECVVVDRS